MVKTGHIFFHKWSQVLTTDLVAADALPHHGLEDAVVAVVELRLLQLPQELNVGHVRDPQEVLPVEPGMTFNDVMRVGLYSFSYSSL